MSTVRPKLHCTTRKKALELYCRVQDGTAFEMAKTRVESVKGNGAVIEFEMVKVRK